MNLGKKTGFGPSCYRTALTIKVIWLRLGLLAISQLVAFGLDFGLGLGN